jgi:hypothetical protein
MIANALFTILLILLLALGLGIAYYRVWILPRRFGRIAAFRALWERKFDLTAEEAILNFDHEKRFLGMPASKHPFCLETCKTELKNIASIRMCYLEERMRKVVGEVYNWIGEDRK